jgi:NAD(P)-dependent dehydrogenase (short-subunit alcohol dehydrogenase family)
MIIITGASKGIGQYLFKKYYESGEIVRGTYNNTIPEIEIKNYCQKVNISNLEDVNLFINNLDVTNEITLINCAGINYNSFAHKADLKDWHSVIDVNLKGTFNIINAFLPVMRIEGFGRIVNLSSVVGQTPVVGTSAYAASKSGLTGMIKSIAVENAKKGVTINNLNLGYYNTGMIKEVPDEYQKILKQKIPCGEFGNPENIFNAIEFIRKSDYITGASIDINGGLI